MSFSRRKCRALQRGMIITVVLFLSMLSCFALAQPPGGETDGLRALVKYRGTALVSGMEIPQDAQLTACYAFEADRDALSNLTEAVALPSSLLAANTGAFDVFASAREGKIKVGVLYIESGQSAFVQFAAPLSDAPQAPSTLDEPGGAAILIPVDDGNDEGDGEQATPGPEQNGTQMPGGSSSENDTTAAEKISVSFEIPCVINPQSVVQTDDGRMLALESAGQTISLALTSGGVTAASQTDEEDEDGLAAVVEEENDMVENTPRLMGILAVDGDLQDVVSISGGALLKNSAAVANNETLSLTEPLMLRYNFTISDTQGGYILGKAGAKYDVPLPAGLAWANITTTKTLNATVGTDNLQFGTLHIDPLGAGVYVVFEGAFWDGGYNSLSDAYVEASVNLDGPAIGNAESYTLNFTGGNSLTFNVAENQKTADKLAKTGAYNAAANRFEWKITYTAGNTDEDRPLTITDTFDTARHVFVSGSIKVDGVNATVASGEPGEGECSVTTAGTTTTIKYKAPQSTPKDTEIIITFETALADAELIPGASANADTTAVNNYALLDSNDGIVIGQRSASASAGRSNKQWMSKTGTPRDRYIDWTVTIRTMDRNLDNLVMYDSFSSDMTLVSTSIRVNGQPLSALGITLHDPSSNAGASFDLDFGSGPYLAEYTVTYSTRVSDEYFEYEPGFQPNPQLSNNAWLAYDWNKYPGTGSGPVDFTFTPPQIGNPVSVTTKILEKSGAYDRASHEITWTIKVNPYHVAIASGTITENLAPLGQTYVAGSLSNGGYITLTSGGDLKNLTFSVDPLLGAGDTTFTFRTKVDNPADFANNTPLGTNYFNTATFDGTINSGGTRQVQDSVTAQVLVKSEVLSKKYIAYDYASNEITWEVTLNQNGMPMTNVILTDTPQSHQTYVAGSAVVTSGPAYSSSEASRLEMKWNTLNAQVVVRYKTKVDVNSDAFKNNASVTVSNSATLSRDTYDDVTVSDSHNIANASLKKTAGVNNNTGTITYTVNINPNKLDISGLVLTDTLPDGLSLDDESVTMARATTANGTAFTAAPGTSFTPNFTYDAAANKFSVTFGAGSSDSYILTYTCFIVDNSPRSFSNSIAFEGNTFGPGNNSSASVANSAGGGGGGTGNPSLGTLAIIKQDSQRSGVKLQGATFSLYSLVNGVETLAHTGVTGPDGKVSFFPVRVNRDYILRETGGIPGYGNPVVLDTSTPIGAGYTVKLTSTGTTTLTVTNDPDKVNIELYKVNDWDYRLDGANFELTDNASPSLFPRQTATSGTDGKIVFSDVPVGTYTLKETNTLSNHDANNEVYKLIVHPSGAYELQDSSGAAITDKKVVNISKKADVSVKVFVYGTSQPLAGTPFQILDKFNNVVGTAISDAAGTLAFTNLIVGEKYSVVELSQSSAYQYSAPLYVTLASASGENVDWPKIVRTNSNSGIKNPWAPPNTYFPKPIHRQPGAVPPPNTPYFEPLNAREIPAGYLQVSYIDPNSGKEVYVLERILNADIWNDELVTPPKTGDPSAERFMRG